MSEPMDEAAELVIHTEKAKTIALDQFVKQLTDYKECQKMIKFWADRLKKLKTEMGEIMGDNEIGTVNGDAVFFYESKDAFRGKDFKAEMPDTYRSYVRDVTTKKFDKEWVRLVQPDLYEKYKVRAMRSTWDE